MQIDVKQKVDKAISKLFKLDQYLLIHDLNERTIAHKLAVYLQEEFNKYDVDCEYNRNADEISKMKMIYVVEEEFKKIKNIKREFIIDIIQDDIEYMRLSTFPDVIIHERGKNTSNQLVIEIKKSTNNIDRAFDFKKLECYTDQSRFNRLAYEWGLFIEFETGIESPNRPQLTWFKDGKTVF